jgi:hypothetical protein
MKRVITHIVGGFQNGTATLEDIQQVFWFCFVLFFSFGNTGV